MRKSTKLVIASGKGGVGKSMLASSLAMLFSKKKKIVAVDADVDAPNLHLWLGQNENWDKVKKISTGKKPVIDRKKCNLCGQCVDICPFKALFIKHRSLFINPFFCEGCGACAVVCPQKAIHMKSVYNAEIRIKKNVFGFPLISAQLYPGETGSGKIVDEIKSQAESFDYQLMLLDSPAGTGCPVASALKDADEAILVTEPTPSGFADLKKVLTMVNYFKIPFGVVINKWDVNSNLSDKIEKEFKSKLLGKIGYDQRIFKAIANLKPIMKTDLPVRKEIELIFKRLKNVY